MANHLHWYIHGSIGARDGQEVDITKPLNLYAETVYTITVQDDRFLPILEDTVFHADVDYLILLDLI